MDEWIKQNFGYIFPLFFVGMWILTGYLVALAGGWRLLAKRFRAPGPFQGQKWRMQSARMRVLSNYNNVLTFGADSTGLFMVPIFFFRIGHPPLFVPWVEISVLPPKRVFLMQWAELRLGRSEQVPLRIMPGLAAKLEAAAGSSWPRGYTTAMESPPPPIG